jgi:hypothetical protein
MSTRYNFEHVSTDANVAIYRAAAPILQGLLHEVRELSKKKPEATMSAGKVKMINRVLQDLLVILKDLPAGKYLELLDDASLPQISDALLTMVQFNSVLSAFQGRYYKKVAGDHYWITEEKVKAWKEADEDFEPDADDIEDLEEDIP